MDRDNVALLVRKPHARRATILGRCEHRAKVEHGAIGILMRLADQFADQGRGSHAVDIDDEPSSKSIGPFTESNTSIARTLSA